MASQARRFLGLTALLLTSVAGASEPWHHPLYLAGDGHWRQRFRIEVQNGSDRPLAGWPVSIAMPAETVGTRAEAIRLCTSSGAELLFQVLACDGRPITEGPIPTSATMTLPVDCEAGQSASCYVYFDNPAAWPVPDFFKRGARLFNGDLELGSSDTPAGWVHDEGDREHQASWSSEGAQSGRRCLKTVVAGGAEPTWISTRQHGITILGGARYAVRAWVKAEQVKGNAGWYVHVGTAAKTMMISPMLLGGGGTYGWKQVRAEFTAPAEADRADLGTVLRGTGTAWFDNVSLECLDQARVAVKIERPERIELRAAGGSTGWYSASAGRVGEHRAVIHAYNFTSQAAAGLICCNVAQLNHRLHGRLRSDSLLLVCGGRPVPFALSGETLLAEYSIPDRTVERFELYFSDQASGETGPAAGLSVESLNLVKNGSFEAGQATPTEWATAESEKAAGVVRGFDTPGAPGCGQRCLKLQVAEGTARGWRGWTQGVAVRPNRDYLVSAWVKARDLSEGMVTVHLHLHNDQGKLCAKDGMTSLGTGVRGTGEWSQLTRIVRTPPDAARITVHLTMNQSGTVWHDGVQVAEVLPGKIVGLEGQPLAETDGLKAWPLNPIIKAFPDEPAAQGQQAASLLLARNEKEPLQICLRSGRKLQGVRAELEPLAGPGGARLDDIQINVVGYVPIDYPTNYYRSDSPAWQRKTPSRPGACDGWPGLWPDPLVPEAALDLETNVTRAVWITIGASARTVPGQYAGCVRLTGKGQDLARVPLAVRVADFALPEERHVTAIYDVRLGNREHWGGTEEQWHARIAQFIAQRRLCADHIRPEPTIRYVDGRVQADYSAFDEAARRHFEEWKMPVAYMPRQFYLFGWGHPPGKKFGELPYPGQPPFEGADRSKLRPEFKAAYQACLRSFWEHVTEKGWAKKFIFYISDEPYDRHEHIRQQMKTLCDMVHEVDRAIPIYSSTWHYVPDWLGYLDVWGIGHYGRVLPEKMTELKSGGARIWFTTDGQMCTDTPLCATERLLPHYCWKYGAEAYEFWGVAWLTYDPYRFGWHSYIHQSGEPGKSGWVRYPNGDGFLLYPGKPIGQEGPISSIRLEQAREGVEDYEYLWLLRQRMSKAERAGRDTSAARAAMERAARLVEIPNAGGKYTSKNLSNPAEVLEVKRALAEAIEGLGP